MRYMGGKERQAKYLVPEILKHGAGCTSYLEPFLGGASIFSRMAPHFPGEATGADIQPDLILMWNAVLGGWDPPTSLTREEWYVLKASEPSALRGFAGFGCSFGGMFFQGYAKESPGHFRVRDSHNSVLRKAARMTGAKILLADYREFDPGPGTLVYCDPPYAGTTGYVGVGQFDHAEFWTVARAWATDGATVLVSEYAGPDFTELVWERATRVLLNRDSNTGVAIERLFRVRG